MATLAVASAGEPASVGVDPRIELFNIIFRLAGNPEYNQGRVPRYNQAVEAWFRPHRNHQVIRIASELRRSRGVGYDAVAALAIHTTDVATLTEKVPLEAAGPAIDDRWRLADMRRFLEAARAFVRESRFEAFLEPEREYEMTLNAWYSGDIMSAEGVWLQPYTLWFRTRAADPPAGE